MNPIDLLFVVHTCDNDDYDRAQADRPRSASGTTSLSRLKPVISLMEFRFFACRKTPKKGNTKTTLKVADVTLAD